ncbi:hypothetical protein AB836_00460 [Rickettsiales bacterium (ex Bugula neritina AB1)]|nr:hypothetical protein AB836_00460 [Rickettsiales bacterium (ex Bugula neritina AB1)]
MNHKVKEYNKEQNFEPQVFGDSEKQEKVIPVKSEGYFDVGIESNLKNKYPTQTYKPRKSGGYIEVERKGKIYH